MMLSLTLPRDLRDRLVTELRGAGTHEIGGILLAEHAGFNEFIIRDMTFHRAGTFSSFVRKIEDALGRLKSFFHDTNHQYSRFNYIGEWHSHPSFAPEPSQRDDSSMRDIIQDLNVGANFVVPILDVTCANSLCHGLTNTVVTTF
jgi:[CysO sulfur-carrier protein]-S-L-cysteine hydrolase